MELPDDVFEVLLHRAHTGQYVNSVAHDLNNLIGAAMAYAELIEMDTSNSEIKRMVGEIVAASEKSAELLNAITAIARPLRIDNDETIGVKEVFDALELLYAYDCKLSQVAFAFTIGEEIGHIAMEQHLAQRILMRLIDNAMESVRGTEAPKVTLSATLNDGNVQLLVADSGPDVPDDIRDKVFDPGFTTKDGHLGMGLTTARALAAHRDATVDYIPGEGFALTVRHVTG